MTMFKKQSITLFKFKEEKMFKSSLFRRVGLGALLAVSVAIGAEAKADFAAQLPMRRLCQETLQDFEGSLKVVAKSCRGEEVEQYFYRPDGKLLKKKVGDRLVLKNLYDVGNNLIFSREGNHWKSWSYDEQNRVITTSNYTGSWTKTKYFDSYKEITVHTGRKEFYHNDRKGREIFREYIFPSGDTYWKQTLYNDQGLISRTDSVTDGVRKWEKSSYNENGELVLVENSEGDFWEFHFDEKGLPKRNLYNGSITTEFLYDDTGLLLREDFYFETSGWQGSKIYRYDAEQRLIELRDWSGTTYYEYI